MISDITKSLISLALSEDIGNGDITTESLIPNETQAKAKIISRENLVVCGHQVARHICREINPEIIYTEIIPEGSFIEENIEIAKIKGNCASILILERTLLNFFQRMSGIATETRKYVEAVKDTSVKVVDTRKTTPGFRELDKYAVRVGGGTNHRMGLFDAVLIKNNHIDALSGDIEDAVRISRQKASKGMRVEVEVRNRDELRKAVSSSPDIILLDNMSVNELKESVNFVRESKGNDSILLEASGGVNLSTIRSIAETGVDWISVGALTHSVKASDISLRIELC